MPPKQRSETSSLASNVSLSELLSRLTLAASSNDYDRLLQVSNDFLKSSPNNVLAAKQKIIALIKLDKYKDALTFLEESTFLDKKQYVLEHGFCLYKLGRGDEAEKVLEQGSGRAVEHVRAQNAYRMEDFARSMSLYSALQQSEGPIDREAEDITSNYSAAHAQSTWTTGLRHDEIKNRNDNYEVQFNLAFELIALWKLDEAEQALTHAEKLCSRSGLSDDELKAEQGIILTQLAYIKQLRDANTETALKLYADVQSQLIVDAATRAIALNNQLSIEAHANPFENYRIHNAAAQAFAKSKPFLAQSRIFSNNSLLLSSQAHKSVKSDKKLDYTASLIQLFNELPEQSNASFLNKLTAAFHRDEKDVGTALLLIQTQMQNGSVQLAAVTLEKLFHALKDQNDVKYTPGLISLASVLFPKVGKEDKATALLVEAKSYWVNKGNMAANIASLRNFATLARLNQLLTLQPSPSHSQELELLINEQNAYLKEYPTDTSSHAVLAALYSVISPSNAAQHSSHLPSISSLTKSIDAQSLENQGIPSSAANLTSLKRKSVGKSRPRKRRVRGGKTFDSAVEVDPERWLPLRERSYYKPAKSKKRKTGGATQGGATEVDEVGAVQAETKKADAGGKKKKKARK